MNRREVLKYVALLTGTAVAGGEWFLTGCSQPDASTGYFSRSDLELFDEIGETIIPRTDTPGAKDAEVAKFMAGFTKDCYTAGEQKGLKDGLAQIDRKAKEKYGNFFTSLSRDEKETLLTELDREARARTVENASPHYFTLIKQIVLLGFFTSKPGVTQVLRYNPVPGKYHGCIDYHPGETSWA